MRSVRRLVVVGATIALLAIVAPSVSAGTSKPFYLDKTCSADASELLGYVCTITDSTFQWFPKGTEVHYLSQVGNVVQAAIYIENGSTSGACVWSSDVDAVCTFNGGTGRLTQFHLDVVVTANGDASIWYWNGWYSFGGRD